MPKLVKLSDEEVNTKLQTLDGWSVDDGKLFRELKFRDFIQAFGFMTRVALLAEQADHHPNWSNVYSTVRIHLWTHDAEGLTERDFSLAAAIDNLVS